MPCFSNTLDHLDEKLEINADRNLEPLWANIKRFVAMHF